MAMKKKWNKVFDTPAEYANYLKHLKNVQWVVGFRAFTAFENP